MKSIVLLIVSLFSLRSLAASSSSVPGSTAPRPSTAVVALDLDSWLSSHPHVANAILWEFPPKTKSPIQNYPTTINQDSSASGGIFRKVQRVTEAMTQKPVLMPQNTLRYDQWSESDKQALRDAFVNYSNWLKQAWPLYLAYQQSKFTQKPAGFDRMFNSELSSIPFGRFSYPPMNLQALESGGVSWTVIGSADAFNLFVQNIAFQLAWDASGFSPWSTNDYVVDNASLLELFDGRMAFRYVAEGYSSEWGGEIHHEGHLVSAGVLPSPPQAIFSFFAQKGMIGRTKKDLIVSLLQFERDNFMHASGLTPTCNMTYNEAVWGYNGSPPLIAMMNGYITACPLAYNGQVYNGYDYSQKVHWTGGCGLTSYFTRLALRLMNVPAGIDSLGGHSKNNFIAENNARLWTFHADDPYGIKNGTEIPTYDVLADGTTFQGCFVTHANLTQAEEEQNTKCVSRRAADLWIKYLPLYLLQVHCAYDLNVTDPQNSTVYDRFFKGAYSASELPADLWTRINDKVSSLGGCTLVNSPN